MVVKFDLRVNKGTPVSDHIYSALLFFAVLFMFCSIAVICAGLYGIDSANARITALADERESLSEQLSVLKAEIVGLDSELGEMEKRAEFQITGLPAVDFLSELPEILPEGIVIEELAMTEGKSIFKGAAERNIDIVNFCDELESSFSVRTVGVPSISAAKNGDKEMRNFSLEVEMRPLREVVLMREDGASK